MIKGRKRGCRSSGKPIHDQEYDYTSHESIDDVSDYSEDNLVLSRCQAAYQSSPMELVLKEMKDKGPGLPYVPGDIKTPVIQNILIPN